MSNDAAYHAAYYRRHKERLLLRRRKRVLEDYLANGPDELAAVNRRLSELDASTKVRGR